MIVSQAELAAIIGVRVQTIIEWQRNPDFPVMARRGTGAGTGHKNKYDTVEVIRWLIARETQHDLHSERARLAKEQADKIALENARLRGELIPAAQVASAWTRVVSAVRAKLLGLPTKAAPELIGLTSYAAAELVLDRHVRDALTELTEYDLASGTKEGPDDEAVCATPETQGERMGGDVSEAESRGKRKARSVAQQRRSVSRRNHGRRE